MHEDALTEACWIAALAEGEFLVDLARDILGSFCAGLLDPPEAFPELFASVQACLRALQPRLRRFSERRRHNQLALSAKGLSELQWRLLFEAAGAPSGSLECDFSKFPPAQRDRPPIAETRAPV